MLDLVVVVTSEHLNSKESKKGIVNFYQRKKQIPGCLLLGDLQWKSTNYKRVTIVRNKIREKLLQLGILVKVQASGVSFFVLKIVY